MQCCIVLGFCCWPVYHDKDCGVSAHSSLKSPIKCVEMCLEANVCSYNWSVICDHSNSFISSLPLPHPHLHPFTFTFFFSHSEVMFSFSGSISSIWKKYGLMICPHSFIRSSGICCSNYVVEGQVALSTNSVFSFEGIFSHIRWRNCHFWYSPLMIKEFRDSLNRHFYCVVKCL